MRLAITLLAILLGLLVAVGAFYNASSRPTSASPEHASEQTAQVERAEPDTPAEEPAASPETSTAAAPPAESAPATNAATSAAAPMALGDLHALAPESPGEAVLGSTDPDTGFKVELHLNRYGAAVTQIGLAEYHQSIENDEAYVIHGTLTAPEPDGSGTFSVHPYAARTVTINGSTVQLDTTAWSLARQETTADGQWAEYRLTIADHDGQPIANIVRRYELTKGSYDFRIEQRIENLSGGRLRLAYEQYLQGDLPLEDAAYLGDRRMFVTGYFNLKYDPARTAIYTEDAFTVRSQLLSDPTIWPNPALTGPVELAWLASENRYFTVVTHTVVPEKLASGAAMTTANVPPLEMLFPRLSAVVFPTVAQAPHATKRALIFTVTSATKDLAPGAAVELPLAVFAGPREQQTFDAFPYPLLDFHQLVRYELSCSWFTFQPLARGLLWLLEMFHWVVKDWGIAIILLVLLVRLILHPLTKRAQVNMMKMGKQMQAIQPEIQKLKKKYADDQPRLNQETMKLYREKNINPANMLGCLPLMLQTPIWIALYAMLYFAIELRHQPAFYGVFQMISGGAWEFLGDLSSPDYFWRFAGDGVYLDRVPGTGIDFIPLVDLHFSAINVLPILMGVVFYFNMKFTSPPPPATAESEMTEQQRMMQQQQKIMRWVFPFMMPVFLYSAPSGLTLYICASTFAGIIDSYLVRKHVREAEASGKLFDAKPVKPGSLRDRMQKYMEQKQAELMSKQAEMQQKQQGRGQGPRGKRR